MRDQYGREINYLRISLTDRCNLRCCYCRPEIARQLAHSEILTYEEILTVCRAAAALGVRRFKVTGGEPLLRRDCVFFLRRLKQLAGCSKVTLTTNGILLPAVVPELVKMGLDGINISLDTLDRQRYAQITGADRLAEVLQAIRQACAAGIKVKLNCVPLQDMSETELLHLVVFAHRLQVPLRFIELMPLSCNNAVQGLGGSQIRSRLTAAGFTLTPDKNIYGSGPAVYYRLDDKIVVGFIEPLHGKFCSCCNRIRLTATGYLKTCLYGHSGVDLRELLRSGADDIKLQQAILQAVRQKPLGHDFEHVPAAFTMNEIGG